MESPQRPQPLTVYKKELAGAIAAADVEARVRRNNENFQDKVRTENGERKYPVPTLHIEWMRYDGLPKKQLDMLTAIENYESRNVLPLVLRLAEDDDLRLVLTSTRPFGPEVKEYVLREAVKKRVRRTGEATDVVKEHIESRLVYVTTAGLLAVDTPEVQDSLDRQMAPYVGEKPVVAPDAHHVHHNFLQQRLEDRAAVERIQAMRQEVDQAVVSTFHGNNKASAVAARFDTALDAPTEQLAQEVGGKTGNRRLFEKTIERFGNETAFTLGKGYGALKNVGDVVRAQGQLLLDGVEDVVIKIDNSFSGLGNVRLNLREVYTRALQTYSATIGEPKDLDEVIARMNDGEISPENWLDENTWPHVENALKEHIYSTIREVTLSDIASYAKKQAQEQGLPVPDVSEAALIERFGEEKIEQLVQRDINTYLHDYLNSEHGGIVEQWVPCGEGKSLPLFPVEEGQEPVYIDSPSVQVDIDSDGNFIIVSSHDQILDGQTYLGAKYPANELYREQIEKAAAQLAQVFAEEGVRGRLAFDFVVTRNMQGEIEVWPIEANVRKGGTTHPFETAYYMYDNAEIIEHTEEVDGKEQTSQVLFDQHGHQIYYQASDNLYAQNLKGVAGEHVLAYMEHMGLLYFDPSTQDACGHGITIHMQGAIEESGKMGYVVMNGSPKEVAARAILFEEAVKRIDPVVLRQFAAARAAV